MTAASRRPPARRTRAVRRFARTAASAAVDAVACAAGTAAGTVLIGLCDRWFTSR